MKVFMIGKGCWDAVDPLFEADGQNEDKFMQKHAKKLKSEHGAHQ